MPPPEGKRILLVEDEYFLAEELAFALQAAGATVIGPFPTVSQAQEALKIKPVQGAILNVRVRDGPTYVLATQLRTIGVPFVFATGQDKHHEPSKWHDVPWVEKPYSPKQAIQALIDASATKR